MNRILIVIFFCLTGILFHSCGKDAVKKNPDYEGQWSSISPGGQKKYILTIDDFLGSKYGECPIFCTGVCDCDNAASGNARIKGNKLSIGNKTFQIIREPAATGSNGQWTMNLDGNTYVKYVVPLSTCFNNMKDPGETGVDCGGKCDNNCYDNFTFDIGDIGTYYANDVQASVSGNTFNIMAAYDTKESPFAEPIVELSFTANSIGSYNFNPSTLFTIDINWSSGFQQPKYQITTGTVNVTYLNTSTRTISFTFEFKGLDSTTGNTIEISHGNVANLIY